jgi:hypothetical protein
MRWNQPVCSGDNCTITTCSNKPNFDTLVILKQHEVEWLVEHNVHYENRILAGRSVINCINLPKKLAIEFYLRFSS